MTEYKLLKKIVINSKKRNIYKKKGSKKQYIKCKGKMMNLVKYKKMKTKKIPKKKKLSRKTKKKGGDYPTTQFYKLPPRRQAYLLLKGYRDLQERERKRERQYHLYYRLMHNELLIPFSKYHVDLIYKKSKGMDVKQHDFLDMKRKIKNAERNEKEILIKIILNNEDLKYMDDYKLRKTENTLRRDKLPTHTQTQNTQDTPVQQYSSNPRVKYTITTYQGTPFKQNRNEAFEGCNGNNTEETVPFCKVDKYYFKGQKCDNVPNRCKLDERATRAYFTFKENPEVKSVQVGPGAREAAERHVLGNVHNGGKKKKVKKSKNPSKK